jgi:hypothetical protein
MPLGDAVHRTGAWRRSETISAISAVAFRPADAAWEYSDLARRSIRLSGTTVQLTVIRLTRNVKVQKTSCVPTMQRNATSRRERRWVTTERDRKRERRSERTKDDDAEELPAAW